MHREIACECGFSARGADDNELVALAQAHAHRVHHMDFPAEQLLALVLPCCGEDLTATAINKRHEEEQ